MAQLLPGDNPLAYIPEDRRRALGRGEDLPHRTRGAALFVDISGFTPLTEALARELGGRRGAEELTVVLQRVFAALLDPLHRWGGCVVYFSGDAVTAWIDGDDGTKGTACALTMQEVMTRVGNVTTPGGSSLTLGIKVAVAIGEVHRFVVGDPDVQLIDVLAGELMDSLAAAEQCARSGEVVLDGGALRSLDGHVVLREVREAPGGLAGVVQELLRPPAAPLSIPEWPRLPDDIARQWLLPSVWERMVAGRGEFLADLRPAVPLFVRFGGLDFEQDPDAPAILDDFVTRSQQALDALGGSVLQLTIGDKGAYLYAVFGAPIVHENDAVRACEGALALLDVAGDLPVTDVQVGIATGRLRSGTYGHDERRTFCCLGDAVNLAARLMTRARPGEIWVHGDVADATGDRFDWEQLPAVRVKGREQQVPLRALRGRATRRVRRHARGTDALVGRVAELERLRELWREALAGRGRVVVVHGEAGTGKSRLVAELLDGLDADGVVVATGEASPLASGASYVGWRGVWRELLGLGPDDIDPVAITGAVARLDPELVARAPLLGPVLGGTLPDNELTASFDGELRKTSLEDLLGRLLGRRAAHSAVAVVVEDAHWLDPLSRDLLETLGRAVARLRVLLVVVSRPEGTPGTRLPLGGHNAAEVALEALDPAASSDLVRARHRALVGSEPDDDLVTMVLRRAEGNPFYLEQLIEYVIAEAQVGNVGSLELPTSLHTLVLSRIDGQPEGQRRAAKVASVIGRAFSTPLVRAAYPELGHEEAVHQDLFLLSGTRLVELEDPASRAFAFGHAVTRDVAYDSLPFHVRVVLHGRVGAALESEPEGPRRHVDLLAHHFSLSDDLPKKRHYLRAAADAARTVYANRAAVGYLEQLLPLAPASEQAGLLLLLAESLEVSGDWSGAREAVGRSLASAEGFSDLQGIGLARTAQAELERKQGRYVEAEQELAAAETAFGQLGDESGRARVLHLRGTLESQQGNHEAARTAYEASLELRERLGDEAGVAALLTNLALVAEDDGDLAAAERLGEEGLARRRALGDRRAISVSLTNMGMLATASGDLRRARGRFHEAQGLAEEVGDPWVVAVGHHNLANVTRDLGELGAARDHFGSALQAYAERDDRWSLAHLFEDVATWAVAGGPRHDTEAVALLAAAERLREEIGAPRFPPTDAALADALAPARDRTPEKLLGRAAEDGRDADLATSVARAARLLRPGNAPRSTG